MPLMTINLTAESYLPYEENAKLSKAGLHNGKFYISAPTTSPNLIQGIEQEDPQCTSLSFSVSVLIIHQTSPNHRFQSHTAEQPISMGFIKPRTGYLTSPTKSCAIFRLGSHLKCYTMSIGKGTLWRRPIAKAGQSLHKHCFHGWRCEAYSCMTYPRKRRHRWSIELVEVQAADVSLQRVVVKCYLRDQERFVRLWSFNLRRGSLMYELNPERRVQPPTVQPHRADA